MPSQSTTQRPKIAIPIFITLCLSLFACSEKSSQPLITNHSPTVPIALTPSNNSQNNQTNITLSWQCSDPEGDSLSYDIFFGDLAEPPLADSNLTEPSYTPPILEFNTLYYWQVRARDGVGNSTMGPLWWFRTKSFSGIQLLGSVDIPHPSEWYEMAELNNYLYLAAVPWPMYIFNINDPAQPILAGQYSRGDSFVIDIALKDQVAFLIEYKYGLEAVNLSNPATPSHLGAYRMNSYPSTIVTRDNYAYVSYSNGIITLDTSDPSNLVALDTSGGSAGYTEVIRNYAYSMTGCGAQRACINTYILRDNITFEYCNSIPLLSYCDGFDEEFAVNYRFLFISHSYGNSPMEAYSLVSPTNPQVVYYFPQDSINNVYAPFINGELLYTASKTNRTYGIKIFDIDDILNPQLLAHYPTDDPVVKIFVVDNHIYAVIHGNYGARLLVFGYLT